MKNRTLWLLAITFLTLNAVLLVARSGTAGDSPEPADEPMIRGAMNVITNFRVVDDEAVYRGARPDAAGISALHDLKVKTDIDLQGGDAEIPAIGAIMGKVEPGETKKAIQAEMDAVEHWGDMKFVSKPLMSILKVDKAEEVKIDEILAIMHDPKQQPVYVHCAHGNDRTGMVVALYRVKYDGMSIKDAHDEMVRDGHRGFWDHIFTHPMDTYFYQESKRILKEQAAQPPAPLQTPVSALPLHRTLEK